MSLNTSVKGYDSSFVSEGLGFESQPGHLLHDYSWFCQTIHAPVSSHSRFLLHPFQFITL